MVNFDGFLKNWSLWSNSVTRQVIFNKTNIGGKWQNWKIQMRHFCVIFNIFCKYCKSRFGVFHALKIELILIFFSQIPTNLYKRDNFTIFVFLLCLLKLLGHTSGRSQGINRVIRNEDFTHKRSGRSCKDQCQVV